MAPLLRIDVMRPNRVSGHFELVRLVERSSTPSQFNPEFNWTGTRAIFDTRRFSFILNR
jgi:hypothetical protein